LSRSSASKKLICPIGGSLQVGGDQNADFTGSAGTAPYFSRCPYNVEDFKRFDTLIRIESIDSAQETSIK
jgi:hypothetical protein